MQTLQQTYNSTLVNLIKKESKISQFINWCNTQQKFRYGWLAVIIAVHGCALTPMTVSIITFGSNSILLWMMAIAGMAASLITNLAALPTRITIPVFILSVFVDLVIIGYSFNYMLSVGSN